MKRVTTKSIICKMQALTKFACLCNPALAVHDAAHCVLIVCKVACCCDHFTFLQVIAATPNVCNYLHMPAQSGSSATLQRMRRGYTREAYDALVQRAREVIPNVALSTDIITGADHCLTSSRLLIVHCFEADVLTSNCKTKCRRLHQQHDMCSMFIDMTLVNVIDMTLVNVNMARTRTLAFLLSSADSCARLTLKRLDGMW